MEIKLSVPLEFRRGTDRDNEPATVARAMKQLDFINDIKPIAGARILDFGCGVKLAQALYQKGHPQQLYAGVDVYKQMIEFMIGATAGNPKYYFSTVDFYNKMYNRQGTIQMTPSCELPLPSTEPFDILTMFSVITHMEPSDAAATFAILRRYTSIDSVLIFTAFVDNSLDQSFMGWGPHQSLLRARYREELLRELVTGAGWDFAPLPTRSADQQPLFVKQRPFVCRAAAPKGAR